GVGWRMIEQELYERYGYVRDNGKPYSRAFFYKRIFTPTWWGHSARFYKGEVYGQKSDLWVYDESYPLPEDAIVFRNTHEPIWDGDLAKAIQSEIARRRMTALGS